MDKKHMKKLGFTSIEGYITEDFGRMKHLKGWNSRLE